MGKSDIDHILENFPVYVYSFQRDADGTYALNYAPDQFYSLLGVPRIDPVTDIKAAFEKVVAEDLPGLVKSIETAAETVDRWSHEFRAKGADGDEIWLYGESIPQDKEGGRIIWNGFLQNITESRKSVQTLADELSHTDALVNLSGDAIITVDEDYKIVQWNRGAETVFGYASEEALGNPLDFILPPEDREKHVEHLRAFQKTGDQARHMDERPDIEGIRRDGQRFLAEASISQYDVAGHRYLMVILRDQTERKQVEEALRDREAKIRAIVETSQEWIWTIDLTGKHTYSNPAIEHILGYKVDEIIGRNAFDFMHPEDKEIIQARLPQWIAEKQGWSNLILRWRHKDGSYRTLESNSVPQLNAQNELIGYRGVDRDITTRDLSEKRLLESEQKYRDLVESSKELIFRLDKEGHFTYLNPAWESVLGYSPEEMLGKKFTYFKLPEEAERTLETYKQILKGGTVTEYETMYIDKNGDEKLLEFRARPIFDSSSDIVGTQGMATDITGRREAEGKLRERAFRLAEAERIAHVGNWDWDIVGGSLTWSDEIYRIFGQTPQVFGATYEAFLEMVHPDDRDLVTQAVDRALKGEAYSIDHRIVWADGQVRMVHERGEVTFTAGGNPVRMLGTVQDVTARRKAEQALRDSEENLRNFTENVMEGIFRTTADGEILFANPGFAKMFGWDSVADIKKTNVVELYATTEQREELTQIYEKYGRVRNLDIEMRRKDGSPIWVRVSAQKITDSDGNFIWYEGFLTDISESKFFEAEVLRAQKLEMVGELAAGIAHDFNNSLAEIQLNAAAALMAEGLTPNVEEILKSIEASVFKTRGITQQLLTYSSGGKPVRTPTDVKVLLEESVHFSLAGTSMTAKFKIQKGLHDANIDRGQVNQVISNLVLNARQAVSGSGVLNVSAKNIQVKDGVAVGPLKPGDYLQISISDKGKGIAPEDLGKIFAPFFTSRNEGTGLGLFSCYSIIKNHNGWITATSRLGVGSTFTFYIPASKIAESQYFDEDIARGSGKILIMDDNEDIRLVMAKLLDQLGYTTSTSPDGESAIEKLEAAIKFDEPFDLVILDLTIPNGMGGKETAARLRDIDPAVKTIVATGYADEPILADYVDYGFQGALSKPFELKELAAIVKEVLKVV